MKKYRHCLPYAGLAIFGGLVYGITVAPSVTFEDSGEFITAAVTLGIAHPSAYPLYLLIAKLFSYIPFGELGWRVNLVSSFFAVASGLLLFNTLQTRQGREPICHEGTVRSNHRFTLFNAGLAILAMLSGELWRQGTIAEVYGLNLFFVALLLRVQLGALPLLKKIWLNSLLLGLGLGNHLTLVFVAPFLIIDTVWQYRRQLLDYRIMYCLVFFLIGMSVYLYLPLRSSADPYLDWGNPQTVPEIIDVITQKEFASVRSGGAQAVGDLSPLPLKLNYCYRNFNQALPAGFWQIIGITGLLFVFLFGDWRRGFLFTGLIFVYTVVVCAMYNVEENILYSINVFFIPAQFTVILAVGFGYGLLLERMAGRGSRLAVAVGLIGMLGYGTLFGMTNYRLNNRRDYTYARDWAENVLSCTGENGLLLVRIDNDLFPLLYANRALKYRADVDLVNVIFCERLWYRNDLRRRYPRFDLTEPGDENSFNRTKRFIFSLVEQAKVSRTIFFLNIPENICDPWTREGFSFMEYAVRSAPFSVIPNLDLYHPGIPGSTTELDREVIRKVPQYQSGHQNLANYYKQQGNGPLAEYHFNRALEFGPTADLWEDIGMYYQESGKMSEAIAAYEQGFAGGAADETLLLNLGVCYGQIGNKSKEELCYQRALLLRPGYVKAYVNLGVLYARSGRITEAVKVWQTGLSHEPRNEYLLRYLALAGNP